jgi:hypothetical protein
MTRKLFHPLFAIGLLACAPIATAALEVSLTVSGDISEIQALLSFIEERNEQAADDGDNPLKINLHSTTNGTITAGPASMPRPAKLSAPHLSAEKLTPGQSTLVTVAVLDDRGDVDTVAIQVVGTNLSTDLYDDASHGDVKAKDNVWSVTLTPMEATPAGRYELIVTAFDRNGHALQTITPEGEEQPLQVRTDVAIER